MSPIRPKTLSAILLITAAIALLLSMFFSPPGLYEADDIDERLQIIESYETQWLIGQGLVFLFLPLLVAGFGFLAYTLRTTGKEWVPMLGAVAITAGTIAATFFLYLQTTDPRGAYSGGYSLPEDLAYWLWLAGMGMFGVAFLQANLSRWLGYLTVGAAIVYGVVFLLTGAGFMTPFILALVGLVTAIVLLRNRTFPRPVQEQASHGSRGRDEEPDD